MKSELTLWPGIIKWDLCDELNKSGLSSNLLIHLFQRLTELMKYLFLEISRLYLGLSSGK